MKQGNFNMILFQNELIKPITGYQDYFISSFGRVWSNKNNKWLHQSLRGDKKINSMYLSVSLGKNGKFKSFSVHRLVAQEFLSNPDNLPQVNHKDQNKFNNKVDNLEWCSNKYNMTYGNRLNKMVQTKCKNGFIKAVVQCDKKTHQEIQTFPTAKAAYQAITGEKDTGSKSCNISAVCRGKRKSAIGFWWKYVE